MLYKQLMVIHVQVFEWKFCDQAFLHYALHAKGTRQGDSMLKKQNPARSIPEFLSGDLAPNVQV